MQTAKQDVEHLRHQLPDVGTLEDIQLTTQSARGRVVPELNDAAIRETFVYSCLSMSNSSFTPPLEVETSRNIFNADQG